MNPLTIFTPTYNRAHTLERLYQSLCDQTNQSFDWLVIDDGSTDETVEIAKEFSDRYPYTFMILSKDFGFFE